MLVAAHDGSRRHRFGLAVELEEDRAELRDPLPEPRRGDRGSSIEDRFERGEVEFLHARMIEHGADRSEEHTSELQSLMRISYAVFCLKKKTMRHANHLS